MNLEQKMWKMEKNACLNNSPNDLDAQKHWILEFSPERNVRNGKQFGGGVRRTPYPGHRQLSDGVT